MNRLDGADLREPWPDAPLLDVRAVVFDMDGLLLDSERLALKALRLAGGGLGVDLPQCFCHLLIGVPVDTCRKLIAERYGDAVDADRLLQESARQLDLLVDAGLLRMKPGVVELLDHLDALGLPRAVATSSGRHKALGHLRTVGLLERFDFIVTRDEVARGKPHPDLFLLAAERLGVPPSRCLALEDSHNGVRAAHASGMPVIMIPDLLAITEEMRSLCHGIRPSLEHVVPLLGVLPAVARSLTG